MRIILTIVSIAFICSCNNKGQDCPLDKPIYRSIETTYFYTQPSIDSPIQGKIYQNDDLYVLSGDFSNIRGDFYSWWRICYKGKEGWIKKDFIVFKDEDIANAQLLDRLLNPRGFEFLLLYLVLFGLLSFPIAYFVGRKRRIGFWFSFVLGLLLTPFISWLPTVVSRKKSMDNHNSKSLNVLRKIAGVLLIIIALFGILFNSNNPKDNFISYFLGFGLLAYGIYLLK